MSAAGPYDRWPTGRGFERYYGFLGGDTHQYYPALVHDMHQVEPEKTPEEGYHLTEDLVDKAIGFVADSKQVAPDKPFFMYFAPGAMHAPHHVAAEWSDKYRGAFDDGWGAYREKVLASQKELGVVPADTELSADDPDVPEWSSLPDDERRLYARMMEVYAGFLEHTDHHFGRLIDFLDDIGELDNTLIMVISDNGASAEGGPTGSVNENKIFNRVPESLEENLAALDDLGGPKHFNHYAWGWTWAGNTPFRRWKRETYRGGISDPFIVSWPAGIDAKGVVRDQFVHAVDMVPTVLDLLGLEPPDEIKGVSQSPIEGASFAATLRDAEAPAPRTTQYFEMFGHRSIYHDGWRAVCPYPGPNFTEGAELGYFFGDPISIDRLQERDRQGWELYHVTEDPSERHDVADAHSEVLQELITHVVCRGRQVQRFAYRPVPTRCPVRGTASRSSHGERDRYIYLSGHPDRALRAAAAKVLNRPHVIAAVVDIPDGRRRGGVAGPRRRQRAATALFVEGQPGSTTYTTTSAANASTSPRRDRCPTGRDRCSAISSNRHCPARPPRTAKALPGPARCSSTTEAVGFDSELPYTMPITISIDEGLTCGQDTGSPASDLYVAPFAFSGTIHRVVVDISGERVQDHEAEIRIALARQ